MTYGHTFVDGNQKGVRRRVNCVRVKVKAKSKKRTVRRKK